MGTNEARSGKNPRLSCNSHLGIIRDQERVLKETLHNRIFHEIHWSLAGRSRERNPLPKIGETTAAITSGGADGDWGAQMPVQMSAVDLARSTGGS
jgi:hypothetical protein